MTNLGALNAWPRQDNTGLLLTRRAVVTIKVVNDTGTDKSQRRLRLVCVKSNIFVILLEGRWFTMPHLRLRPHSCSCIVGLAGSDRIHLQKGRSPPLAATKPFCRMLLDIRVDVIKLEGLLDMLFNSHHSTRLKTDETFVVRPFSNRSNFDHTG